MGCEGCIQKILNANEQKRQILEKALALANKEGEWVAVYLDEFGSWQHCLAAHATGIFVEQYVTPEL